MLTISLMLTSIKYSTNACFVMVITEVIVQLYKIVIVQDNVRRTIHYSDVIMGTIASHITSLTIVISTVYSDADQRKHQSSVSLAFVRGIHRGPVNSPHKWPITRKMFPFDDVIMTSKKSCFRKAESTYILYINAPIIYLLIHIQVKMCS